MGCQIIAISLLLCFLSPALQLIADEGIGYRLGKVTGYQLKGSFNLSKLYELKCPELEDGRPMQLVELVGSHYEVGYAYGALLGRQIVETYHTFLTAQFKSEWEIFLLQSFLSWQYDSYVSEQIPQEFKQEMRGIQRGGAKEQNIHNLRSIVEQTLVVSSYPGDFTNDIAYALLDEFLRDMGRIGNEKILNIVEDKIFQCVKLIKDFFNKKRVHCSFFALWGDRTSGGKLITMRNLDWEPNTGMNKHKTVFVWKVAGTIPHATIGFPGIIGALTGISKAGLTVHEAGLDSFRETELGFQWTLRLRYIMMHAENLEEARQIWVQTNNTLGMNHMVASASDLATNEPVFVVETMRNYTAWFKDDDERERGAKFVDPKSKKQFQAGFAMKQAVFRTNHAYDPKIIKYRTLHPGVDSDTIRRYIVMKNGIALYEQAQVRMGAPQAINVTAATAHKGGADPYRCPQSGDNGTNVISVVYLPASLTMHLAFEYGEGSAYRTACCGVYAELDLNQWFK